MVHAGYLFLPAPHAKRPAYESFFNHEVMSRAELAEEQHNHNSFDLPLLEIAWRRHPAHNFLALAQSVGSQQRNAALSGYLRREELAR